MSSKDRSLILWKEISPARILREGVHYYVAGAVMASVLIPVAGSLSPSPIHTAVIVVVGASAYFATLFMEKDEFLITNVKHISNKITRRR